MKSYVSLLSPHVTTLLTGAEHRTRPDMSIARIRNAFAEEGVAAAKKLFHVLVMNVRGPALAVIGSITDMNGALVWPALIVTCAPITAPRAQNLMSAFANAKSFPSELTAREIALDEWQENIRKCETISGDNFNMSNGRNGWYDLGYQGAKGKAPPCPNNTLQTTLPQQSSLSAREAEDLWEVMEERRRRRIAFGNLAKGMLRYRDNCNEVKVGITVLHERVEVPLQFGISIQKVAQQAMNEDGQKMFEVFWQEGEEYTYCQLGQMGGAAERLSRFRTKVSRVVKYKC